MARAIAVLVVLLALAGGNAAAMPTTLQGWNDETTAWLEETLHAHVDQRTIVATDDLSLASSAAEFNPATDTVAIRPRYAYDLLSARVRLTATLEGTLVAGQYLRHEALHRRETIPCYGDGHDEEGIVDLLANHLDAAWSWRFLRVRPTQSVFSYPDEARDVKYAILAFTGNKRWGRGEEFMLRKLWAGSCEYRAAVFAQAASR